MKNQEREISQFDLFTGGRTKTADMAIYYNMAVKNIEKIINFYEKKSEPGKREELNSKAVEIKAIKNESTFGHLAEYLWKAHTDQRNSSGILLTDDDKQMIVDLWLKLNGIRDYHSHIWHSHEVLVFTDTLANFVNNKYAMAMAKAYEKYPDATKNYEQSLLKKREPKHDLFFAKNGRKYITEEGRVFFLSFFLTTGQMSNFLQQRKGSKRNDIPLFKVKHFAYKYYCHRDGASIMGFHHEDGILEKMDTDDKRNILLARQAYKLITYLHDYPDYLANNDRMPLLLPAPESKEKLKKVETIQDLLAFIRLHNILPGCAFIPISFVPKASESENKEMEELERTGTVLLDYSGIDSYRFQINFDNLYMLVMLWLKYGEEKLSKFKSNLEKLAEQRRNLYEILVQDPADLTEDELIYMLDRENQYLRGSRKLTENGIQFFEEYGKKLKGKDNSRVKLANYIRPDGAPWHELPKATRGVKSYAEHEAEPIVIFAQDFIEKTEQKFRAGNRFMFYAAKYLIDHRIVPDWHWEVEKFDMVKKDKAALNAKDLAPNALQPSLESLVKMKELHTQIPDEYRLSIENDHVTIGILKDGQTAGTDAKKRYEAFYQFSIGPKAMRYLLAIHAMRPDARLNDFLAVAIKNDFKNITENAWTGKYDFKLLEDQFLPEYLKEHKTPVSLSGQIEKLMDRVKYITTGWDSAITHLKQLKRAEKNIIVLEAYRLFDWESNGNVKFLRANEYKYISVCHYSLKDKVKQPGERYSKFDHLYNNLFALSKRKPPIPKAVKEHIDIANSLDDLLVKVVKDRSEYLQAETDLLKILPGKLKKEKLVALSRKLGLSVPSELLSEIAKDELPSKRAKTLAVLPFAIHPILVMKYFMPHLYKDGYIGIKEQPNGIFQKLRDPVFTNGLHKEHYDTDYLRRMIQSDDEATNAVFDRQRKRWVGIINTTQTEDAILWWVAKKYLANNRFTSSMAIALSNNTVKNEKGDILLSVGSLYGQQITMPLSKLKDGNNDDDTVKETLHVQMMMHQTDDVMYSIDKEQLRRAATHYLRRHKEERDLWETLAKNDEDIEMEGKDNIFTCTKEDPIPYETLRREMQLIARHAAIFAETLLDWERHVLDKYNRGKTAEQKQSDLITHTSKKLQSHYDHVDFKKIIELAGLKTDLSEAQIKTVEYYRNKAMHSGIPVVGSYAWIGKSEGELSKILGVDFSINRLKDKSRFIMPFQL